MDLIRRLVKWFFAQQLLSYLFVGGVATLVEWLLFYILYDCAAVNYLLATAIAFTLSTGANWGVGRLLTFKDARRQQLASELTKIYAVAVVGLLGNLGLMYVFVDVLGIHKMISKILATIIVFSWNYLSRKLWIYKN